MEYNIHFWQKVMYIVCSIVVNGALSTLSIIYSKYWYIFLVPLSLATVFNCFAVIAIILHRLFAKAANIEVSVPKNIGYIIPCYNETKDELMRTIQSVHSQVAMNIHNKVMFIISDGRVKGSGESQSTDQVLSNDILKNHIQTRVQLPSAYKCWDGSHMSLEVLIGVMDNIPFMCFIKDVNMGKRDTLVMIRGLCYELGLSTTENTIFGAELLTVFKTFCHTHNITSMDYVIGTDADTVLADNCSYELLKAIDCEPNTHGVVGFVSISPLCRKWSPWTIYQNTEYIVAQCLRRLQQHLITKKVSCLSGCCQILRISKETSGKDILTAFNYLPKETDNIFTQIRSFASEDRNHVCLMLHMYPYVQTRQCIRAWSYTIVPMSLSVFRSQRRRWSLGATCNDLILVTKSGINIIERIGATINVVIYFLAPFVFVSTIIFLMSIIRHPNIIMLYLCILIFIPMLYNVSTIWWFPFDGFLDRIRFLIGYMVYLIVGPIINILINFYSVINMDVFKWGKTRKVEVVVQ